MSENDRAYVAIAGHSSNCSPLQMAPPAKKWKSFDLDLDSVSGIYTSAP
jgi:hypothetical protein